MPVQTCWGDKGLYVKFSGVITEEDITCAFDELYSDDKRFLSSSFIVWDSLGASGFKPLPIRTDIEAVKGMGKSIKKAQLQCAFVASNIEIIKQIKRYIKMSIKLNSSWQFCIFSSLKNAEKWIK